MGGLGYYSVWWLLLALAGIVALAATPLFAAADTPSGSAAHTTASRLPALDGLRGFLALAVVFHHAAVYHRYLLDGVWELPQAHVFRLLGSFGVRSFFMITGFLFWSQLLRAQGRPAWIRLYLGRVFRIGPLYMVAAVAVLAIVAVRTGARLHEPPSHLAMHLLRWLSIGILPVSEVNGYPQTGLLLADVTWSLGWEWLFYFSLPLLALFARVRRLSLGFALAGLALSRLLLHFGPLFARPWMNFAGLFLLGMIVGSLHHAGWLLRLPDWIRSWLLVAAVVAFFGVVDSSFLLAAMLYLVVSGCTVFGLLSSRPARRLGDISYGIYLLQGLTLAAVFRLPALHNLELTSAGVHWAMSITAAILLVVLATLTHKLVELPAIAAGKRLAAGNREVTTGS
jgi:peptidoglycan/LPS O-acetylase OafA/YrhL